MPDLFLSSVKTEIGVLHLVATENGLYKITLPHITEKQFNKSIQEDFPDSTLHNGNALLKKTTKQLLQYFDKKRTEFSIPLDIQCSPFQKKALQQIAKIKYGTTKTYGEIAKKSGSAKAYRAVGSANATNRIPIIIPCHRVVASNSLGGYAGGVKLKEKLLLLEQKNSHI